MSLGQRIGLISLLVAGAFFARHCPKRPPPISSPEVCRSACGAAPEPLADRTTVAIDDGAQVRTFEVIAPPSPLDPDLPLSLTIVFHGANGTAESAEQFALQDAPGARASSVFLFPQALKSPASNDIGWNEFPCTSYEFDFYDAMVEWAQSHYCIDSGRIFVAGFSWGGDMVTSLACCRGDRIRAIAAASCSDDYDDATNYKTFKASPCPVRSAASIRFTHDASGEDSAYAKPYFATTSSLFQSFNGCAPASTVTGACSTHLGCRADAAYVECGYPGLGHALPKNWGEETWQFFRASGSR